LNAIKSLEPNIVSALTNLDAQHAHFEALPLTGSVALVEADLKTLNTDTTNFENALLAKAPVSFALTFLETVRWTNLAYLRLT
jgi:hypothetical protein